MTSNSMQKDCANVGTDPNLKERICSVPLKWVLLLFLVCVSVSHAQYARNEVIPAGTLLQCTLSEPNFSPKTAVSGDPVLCHLGTLAAFGYPILPRGTELGGRLQDSKSPGRFVGKGLMDLEFDRLVMPGGEILPVSTKVISAPHIRVDPEGEMHGKGHAKRDAVEWMIPVLWPEKIVTLPARGPYPTLKGETRITLRLMDDVEIPPPEVARVTLPAPHGAEMSRNQSPSGSVFRPANYQNRIVTTTPHYDGLSTPDRDGSSGGQLTVIVLQGGSACVAREYWIQDLRMHCISEDGEEKLIPLGRIDLSRTVQLNRERNVPFAMRTKDMEEN